ARLRGLPRAGRVLPLARAVPVLIQTTARLCRSLRQPFARPICSLRARTESVLPLPRRRPRCSVPVETLAPRLASPLRAETGNLLFQTPKRARLLSSPVGGRV